MAKKETDKENKSKNFGKELKSELKKVSWPTTKQLVNNTSAVVSIVLIVSVIVFVLDVCFESLSDFGIGKLKSLVASEVTENGEENTADENNEENPVTNETEGEGETVEPTENSVEDTNPEEEHSEAETIQE